MDSIRRIKNSLFIVCALLLAGVAYAQQVQQEAPNRTARTRTDLLNELTLRDALVVLEAAKVKHDRFEREYQDAERLIKEHIISQKDLDDAWLGYSNAQQELEQAKIQLDRTKLGFLANATHITIMEAKKYRDSEGELMLDLVLKNTSNLALAESALAVTENESELASDWQNPEQIRAMLDIENVIVSIISGGSSIAKPYEKIIPVLSYGAEEKLKFELLTDVQEAGVRLKYLGSEHNENVYLEKESLQDIPTVIASQFSQEGQLGTAISYHLDLEMLVTSDKSFSLLLTNLPPQIKHTFVDSRGARITSVRFTDLVSMFDLTLQISVPEKLVVGMIDKTINFQAWVVTTKQAEMLNEFKRENANQEIPTERFAEIKAGRVDLALIPKGTGRLEIVINNLFKEVKLQQNVDIEADLSNYGTLTLFNIIPELTLPLDWTAKVSPEVIEKLAPNEKTPIQIHLSPGPDVDVGEYEVVIEAKGQSGSEEVEALERRFNIRVSAKTNITATLILGLGLVVLITGIVFMGVKLSRR
ncbi:MAG: COG1470 family protein [Planctomycetota bacterium]|jgi:hypothetical protein